MDSTLRIVPIFAVILAGFGGKRLGLLPDSFQAPANRLVYYFAIPCLIFLKVEKAPFREILKLHWIAASLAGILAAWLASVALSRLLGMTGGSRGTFIQASIHSNLGYIGLAAAYYGLGERGLQAASVFAPFYMLANNGLAVLGMERYGEGVRSPGRMVRVLALHPVIIGSFTGIFWSWAGWGVPRLVEETLGILASMALPLALLLIGAGLGLEALRRAPPVLLSTAIKTLGLPALGYGLLTLAGARGVDRAAAVLLLSAPSATITLIMAREMGGDMELAASAVTLSTLVSAGTLTVWLSLLS